MVRVGQASCWANSEPPKHKHNSGQEQGQNLTPDVQLKCPVWIPSRVITNYDCGARNNAQENDGCNDAVCDNYGMVSSHILEAISHAYSVSVMFGSDKISSFVISYIVGAQNEPLYRIVSKFTPIRLGSRNVSRPESQVPSPT